jgi:hypothetical protein
MPKIRKKCDLPEKICVVCGRPFSWRKKWEKVWAEVKYCSDGCRKRSRPRTGTTPGNP